MLALHVERKGNKYAEASASPPRQGLGPGLSVSPRRKGRSYALMTESRRMNSQLKGSSGRCPHCGAPIREHGRSQHRGERNHLIREYCKSHLSDFDGDRAAARRFVKDARIYAAGEWKHQRNRVTCPNEIRGTARGLLWQIFAIWPPEKLPSADQIRKIIR